MNQQSTQTPRETSLFSLFFLPISLFLPAFLLSLVEALFPNSDYFFQSSVAVYSIFALGALLYLLLCKRNLKDIGFNRVSLPNLFRAFLLGFLLQPAAMLISTLSSYLFVDLVSSSISSMLDGLPLGLLILYSALVPALFEETVCRGVVFFGYRKTLPLWASLLFSGIFFGLIHGNMTQFLYATALGVVFALMNHYTGSIWPSIVTHFTINASQLCLAWLAEKLSPAEALETAAEAEVTPLSTILYLFFLTLITVPFVVLCLKKMKQTPSQEPAVPPELAFDDASRESSEEPAALRFPPFKEMAPYYVAVLFGIATMVLVEIVSRIEI